MDDSKEEQVQGLEASPIQNKAMFVDTPTNTMYNVYGPSIAL
jgi:hypothetical protein